jgi:hypothetical protein
VLIVESLVLRAKEPDLSLAPAVFVIDDNSLLLGTNTHRPNENLAFSSLRVLLVTANDREQIETRHSAGAGMTGD